MALMRVKVKLYAMPEQALEAKEFELRLTAGATVGELLKKLPVQETAYLYIVRNGMRLDDRSRLNDGDTVCVFPPIAGGCGLQERGRWVGRAVERKDAADKVTGWTMFFSDLSPPGMLWARVLRSRYAHAFIRKIDVSKAERHPGVVVVLTHKDVPGLNGYGIVVPDQPVLCWDKVRFFGDAIALVAAETREAADEALRLIEVEYEPLPLLTDPEAAMLDTAPQIHAKGNVFRHAHIVHGDVEAAFRSADVVVENTYVTGRQMHMFLETEAGVGMLDKEGNIVLYVGGQAPYRDQMQVARALGLPRERIRVVSSPVGGAFGGKDEITVQIHLALLALKTGRPVKLVWSREESGIAGFKRHPMKIAMKTAARRDGTLVANKVRIVSDTGAYASLSGTILDVAVENSCGPYRVPNIDVEAWCVYTNNPVGGAFRGFGAPEVNFAMESQMDAIADALKMDQVAVRKRNALRHGDIGPFGNRIVGSAGIYEALEAAERSDLWMNRARYKVETSAPWRFRGVGLAAGAKGCGFGALPDFAACSIELTENGAFTVGVSCPDLGQGNHIAFAQLAADVLRCDIGDVTVVSADTGASPDTGTSSASRSVYAGGSAVIAAAKRMREMILGTASRLFEKPVEDLECEDAEVFVRTDRSVSMSYAEIARTMKAEGSSMRVEAGFDVPRVEKPLSGSIEIPHLVYMYCAMVVLVEVDVLTGVTKVLKAAIFPDAGHVVNPQGLEGQCEGGFVQGMGFALMEDTLVENAAVKTSNFTTYLIPTALDIPEITVTPLETYEQSGPFGAKGVGEVALIPVAPAICSAIQDAVAVRIKRLPATPERVVEALLSNQSRSGLFKAAA